MVTDRHYTPHYVAQLMVEAVPEELFPNVIADFAAGEGSLLAAAQTRWPSAVQIANDMDHMAAALIRKKQPEWIVSTANFLDEISTARSKISAVYGGVDLALINPPFSQRGVKPIEISISGRRVRCGLATAFIHRTLEYLTEDGCVIALLPHGSLYSIRDSAAWKLLATQVSIDTVAEIDSKVFHGVTAKTSIIRIDKRTKTAARFIDDCAKHNNNTQEPPKLFRGRCQMHTVPKRLDSNGLTLLHSTHLVKTTALIDNSVRVAHPHSILGPAVLFPRVGRITPNKICILPSRKRVVLSDCVLGFPVVSLRAALEVRQLMLNAWKDFESLYTGTGAPYITVAKAITFLCAIGATGVYRKLSLGPHS